MSSSVVHELAKFLEALPYQVQAWDHKVIDHLTRNSEIFRNFQKGGAGTKWDIYSSIKYESLT
jgi:hypothetical protein